MKKAIEDVKKQWFEIKCEKVIAALRRRGFISEYFSNENDLITHIDELTAPYHTVGIGGSVTVRELGLVEKLKNAQKVVYDHWEEHLTQEDIKSIKKNHLTCDVFLTSSNAVTLDGRLINTDGSGNRVTAMVFGPKRIVVVVGRNKIVKNVDHGLERIKNIAPLNFLRANQMNYKEHEMQSPCLKDGICRDCWPPNRHCRITTIIEGVPKLTPDYHVLIVGSVLGY